MAIEMFVIFLLIIANGIFAMSEIAVVKARKTRLRELADKGSAKARAALELANAPNQFLSTVQIGITLLVILAGVFSGTTVAGRLSAHLSAYPVVEPYSQALGVALVVIVITYVSVIVGKLVPKVVALSAPETIATLVAQPMRFLSKMASPVVRLLSGSTEVVLQIFGKGPSREPAVTEEEIKTLVQQATQEGIIEESEQDMVEAVFRLGDKTAPALMTPRSQIVWLDLADSTEQIRNKIKDSGHSRFPVSSEKLDNVVGVVQAKDLLAATLSGEPIQLESYLTQATFIPRSMPGLQVLENFKRLGSHIALVINEYGDIEGLLTHHDILEAIAGDMPFGEHPAHSKAVKRHDGSWLLDGMLSVEEFKELFQLESLPGEKKDAYQTLGGFVFTHLGRVPSVSDHFEWNGLRFEVVDMDGKRIDKVLVSPLHENISRSLA